MTVAADAAPEVAVTVSGTADAAAESRLAVAAATDLAAAAEELDYERLSKVHATPEMPMIKDTTAIHPETRCRSFV